jgi:hypothetical protein
MFLLRNFADRFKQRKKTFVRKKTHDFDETLGKFCSTLIEYLYHTLEVIVIYSLLKCHFSFFFQSKRLEI